MVSSTWPFARSHLALRRPEARRRRDANRVLLLGSYPAPMVRIAPPAPNARTVHLWSVAVLVPTCLRLAQSLSVCATVAETGLPRTKAVHCQQRSRAAVGRPASSGRQSAQGAAREPQTDAGVDTRWVKLSSLVDNALDETDCQLLDTFAKSLLAVAKAARQRLRKDTEC